MSEIKIFKIVSAIVETESNKKVKQKYKLN